jgi:hypothetical protein
VRRRGEILSRMPQPTKFQHWADIGWKALLRQQQQRFRFRRAPAVAQRQGASGVAHDLVGKIVTNSFP